MLPVKLDQLSIDVIKRAIASGLREGRTLELKRDLVGGKDEDKREFLADVSSFANTSGGDLIFGVEEIGGEATQLVGLACQDRDAEILRLEQILRSGLEPRLPGVDIKFVTDGTLNCLVIRVGRSYLSPHRIVYKDNGKFFARTSAGKYALDVTELRSAFLSTNGVIEGIRRFQRNRISIIESGDAAFPLRKGPKLVLHLIPLSMVNEQVQIEVGRGDLTPPPMDSMAYNTQYTLDGFATYTGRDEASEGVRAYSILFREGTIEAVRVIGAKNPSGEFYIPVSQFEWTLLKSFYDYRKILQGAGLEPPFYVFVSLLGVRGLNMAHGLMLHYNPVKQRNDSISFPEFLVNDFSSTPEELFRPICDMFWNTFGYPKSFSFDSSGKYIAQHH